MRADTAWSECHQLRASSQIPLAAGENVAGAAAFANAIESRVLSVVQPDLAKWGGFSGCVAVARAIRPRACGSAPIILAAASDCWRRPTCLRPSVAAACSRSTPIPTHSGRFCVAHSTRWLAGARPLGPKQVWERSQICPPWPASRFDTDNAVGPAGSSWHFSAVSSSAGAIQKRTFKAARHRCDLAFVGSQLSGELRSFPSDAWRARVPQQGSARPFRPAQTLPARKLD
jgi:Enolase C-terminal domain-like